MAITFSTNTAGNKAMSDLRKNMAQAEEALGKLSSGQSVTKASQDSSSLSLSKKLNSNIKVLDQAGKNAAQAASLIQVATGALGGISDLLTQMKTLTAKSNTKALDNDARSQINEDYSKLLDQITKITDTTRWNGVNLLTGGAGTVSTASAVTQSASGLGTPGNSFSGFNATDSRGFISGTFESASVTANGSMYDVSVTMKNNTSGGTVEQTFKATVGAPAAAGKLHLVSTTDSANVIVLDYHATDVSDITNASTFQTELQELLALDNPGTSNASVVSTATAVNNGLTGITSGVSAKPGLYAVEHIADSGKIKITNGEQSWEKSVSTTGAAQNVVFDNGITLALDNSYADGTGVTQVIFEVGSGSSVSLDFQVAEKSSDTLSVNISGATASALGITGTSVFDQDSAALASDAIDQALSAVNNSLAQLGAQQKQLESSQENLSTMVENSLAAKQTLIDADPAKEMANFTAANVRAQMGQAAFSQSLGLQKQLAQMAQSL